MTAAVQSALVSQESDPLQRDQALEEQVEQKIQELLDLLESNGETFEANYDPSKSAHSAFHHPTKPPQLSYLLDGLAQVTGLLVVEERRPLLHGFLQWYVTQSLEDLSK